MPRLHYHGVSLPPSYLERLLPSIDPPSLSYHNCKVSLCIAVSILHRPSSATPIPLRLGFPSRPRLPYVFNATLSPIPPPPPSCCEASLCGAGVGRMGGTLAAQDGGRVSLLFPGPNVSEIRRLALRPSHISQFSILLLNRHFHLSLGTYQYANLSSRCDGGVQRCACMLQYDVHATQNRQARFVAITSCQMASHPHHRLAAASEYYTGSYSSGVNSAQESHLQNKYPCRYRQTPTAYNCSDAHNRITQK